jgi:hypothetical protein
MQGRPRTRWSCCTPSTSPTTCPAPRSATVPTRAHCLGGKFSFDLGKPRQECLVVLRRCCPQVVATGVLVFLLGARTSGLWGPQCKTYKAWDNRHVRELQLWDYETFRLTLPSVMRPVRSGARKLVGTFLKECKSYSKWMTVEDDVNDVKEDLIRKLLSKLMHDCLIL